jgi:hypothetical protein
MVNNEIINKLGQLHMAHAASYPVWLQVQKMLRQIYRRSVEVLNLLRFLRAAFL